MKKPPKFKFRRQKMYTGKQNDRISCRYCGRNSHFSTECRYRKIHLDRISRKDDGKLKKVFCCNKPETNLPIQPREKDKSTNVTKKTQLTPATFCSKFTKMNNNPQEITTKINKDGILTIDLANEKSDYLKCQTCVRWELRLHEKMKVMDRIVEENIRLNKEVKLLKELYNVQNQKPWK